MADDDTEDEKKPGRLTLALGRLDALEEITDIREREALERDAAALEKVLDEKVELAKWDTIKAVLTGPNAKYFALLFAFMFGVPALVLGSYLTGYGFQFGKDGVFFGAVPTPTAEEAPAE